GAYRAAQFIAARFEEYGLQPGGSAHSYFDETELAMVWPSEQPLLAVVDKAGREALRFRYRRDFGFLTRGHGGPGDAEGPLTFVAFDKARFSYSYESLTGLDLRGQIVMYAEDNAPPEFPIEALIRGARGLLVVSDRVQSEQVLVGDRADYLRKPAIPAFVISSEAADAILARAGMSLKALLARPRKEAQPWLAIPTEVKLKMSLSLGPVEEHKIRNVIGVLPGKDVILDEQAVIVAAHYDGPGADPDGSLYPGADDNASGVAVLLEIARLWHEQGFEPRRTIVFAAWDGAFVNESGAELFWQGKNVLSLLTTVAVLELDALGHEGSSLAVRGNPRVRELVYRSAHRLGIEVEEATTTLHPYQASLENQLPMVLLTRSGKRPSLEADTVGQIVVDKLDEAVKVVNLTLINLAREAAY
ncbi:MAG TPA: M28 family peptidase, partial [Chloroflexi bacterium]|nr:M28 family peptidase [Chloroflexota bacterium]